jgi:hypothetical protein
MQINSNKNQVNFQAYAQPSQKVQKYMEAALEPLSAKAKANLSKLISDSFEKQRTNKIPIELDVKDGVFVAKVNNNHELNATEPILAGMRGFIPGTRTYMLRHPEFQIKEVLTSANFSADCLNSIPAKNSTPTFFDRILGMFKA